MRLTGTPAIVTGGGSGLGAAAARTLARQGARVSLLDTNVDRAKAVADEVGGFATFCDVADPNSAANALAMAAERHGLPRLLVHCAGVTAGRVPLVGGDVKERLGAYQRLITVNLAGSINMLSLVADQMKELEPLEDGERGVVLLTASVAAFDGQVGMSGYSASKGGVVALVLPAARELAEWGIRVNAVAPGYFDTPILEKVPDYVRAGVANSFIFPKRLGAIEEYAHLVTHMIENPMLNGETIRLDGGLRMPPTFSP